MAFVCGELRLAKFIVYVSKCSIILYVVCLQKQRMSELSVAAQQRPVVEAAVSAGTGHLGLSSTDHFASSYLHYNTAADVAVPVAQVADVCEPAAEEEEPEVDIVINNVVSSFNTRCHLNLRRVATEGMNVVYKRDQGVSILL